MADGLAAQVVLTAELLLGGQLVPGLSAVPGQLLPEPVRQKLVFCRHARAPFRHGLLSLYQVSTVI